MAEKTTHINNLNANQKANIKIIVDTLVRHGITNKFSHAAILAVVFKESNYNPAASETTYAFTPNDRIKKIFTKTQSLSDVYLNDLKKDNKRFFDFIYNGVAGNGATDGYKFRGRGFNQLTGRGNYANIAKLINVDLINYPEKLADPKVAAEALVAYFINGLKTLKNNGNLARYNATSANDFKTVNDSLLAFYHINAGPGQTQAHIKADVTGGLAKSKGVVEDLYTLVNENKAATGGGFFLLILTALAIANRKKIAQAFKQ